MASDDKKVKTNPAQKNEPPPKSKGTSGVDPSKAEGGEIDRRGPSWLGSEIRTTCAHYLRARWYQHAAAK